MVIGGDRRRQVSPELLMATRDRLYDSQRHNQDKVGTIQNWCVTVWLATLTLGASPQVGLTPAEALALPIMALVTFWLLAAFQFTFADLDGERVLRLERILLAGTLDEAKDQDIAFALGHEAIPFRHKLVLFLRTLLLREYVNWFFVVLALATVGFHAFIR